jgi:DNA polymerase V
MQNENASKGDIVFPKGLVPLGQCTEALPTGKWPLFAHAIPAGFPSPADDYTEGRISLDEHLVQHKEATFF